MISIFYLLIILLLCSCGTFNKDEKNNLQTKDVIAKVSEIDTNKDSFISKKELSHFNNNKNIASKGVDYYNPSLIYSFILLLIFLICFSGFIKDFIVLIYLKIKKKCNN